LIEKLKAAKKTAEDDIVKMAEDYFNKTQEREEKIN
jgi:hypothetical protein